ncbi:HNH endonuclease [Saccharopolyspora sp. 6V]|uniref:HNH endonuclease n=1 Tax=Saccharopolyspora sp. 6V TaxID=2877239 RepID=UPI001CD765BF|nr:HNH endonuclease [Saccharopolyspora sp. 6V]MCA1191628.1 HNH endonuclease [Saccharopolyspora sp. 6V]
MAWEGSTRRQRLPANWAVIRRRILRRDHGICHVCHHDGATEVDHINPGDDHSGRNLAAIHVTCHRAKSSREGGEAAGANRRARASARLRPIEPPPGLIED